jgi:hypothetical protein
MPGRPPRELRPAQWPRRAWERVQRSAWPMVGLKRTWTVTCSTHSIARHSIAYSCSIAVGPGPRGSTPAMHAATLHQEARGLTTDVLSGVTWPLGPRCPESAHRMSIRFGEAWLCRVGVRVRDARSGVPGRRAAHRAHPPVRVTLKMESSPPKPCQSRAKTVQSQNRTAARVREGGSRCPGTGNGQGVVE